MNRKARRPSSAVAIDTVQCKRISAPKTTRRKGGLVFATTRRRILEPPEALGPVEILSVGRVHLDKQILPSYGQAMGLSLRSRRFD